MEPPDPAASRKISRRTLLKGGLAAGGLIGAGIAIDRLAGGSSNAPSPKTAPSATATGRARPAPAGRRQPNILVIVVDQLRFPQWFSTTPGSLSLPPNIERLSQEGVSFVRHYTASNDCTPSRAALLTGLYTHQTGALITGGSTLDPAFPTWGTMLREHGYSTRWYGKWHLTRGDYHWTPATGAPTLEHYGFAGGTFPSPDGDPGQGWRADPRITAEFNASFAQEGGSEPWCTTVSFVNPHDIAWWYAWTQRVPAETAFERRVHELPPNFETPAQLTARRKPLLQRSLQDTAAVSFGKVPFSGPQLEPKWLAFLDLYVKLQREVDRHVGSVLRTLASNPKVAENTVVIFTSDHGEYGASHGLRGKGAGAYEEAIRVPLIVRDPRGLPTSGPGQVRTQLTSSVDVAPLLLTLASGSGAWRGDPHYAHIAGRLDLAGIVADPSASGRPYVLHTTDEIVTEFAVEPYAADAPLHVVAMRTPSAKYAVYSDWARESTEPIPIGQESELYDYSSEDGRLELSNGAGQSALEESMRAGLEHAIATELHAPLPPGLDAAQRRGFADYFSVAKQDAQLAAKHRKTRTERDIGPVDKLEGPEA
jgi:arylsulfatase A-like enzyme